VDDREVLEMALKDKGATVISMEMSEREPRHVFGRPKHVRTGRSRRHAQAWAR
jgi:hypothetical protein